MTVIHCHDDKQFLILDHERFLANIYSTYHWSSSLFNVDRPFRSDNEQSKKKKRKFDEAFDEKFETAADFSRNFFSKLERQRSNSSTQREYSFDEIPFAQIATDQRDRLTPIREILLTDYFLRASKLGIQTNILYTHDKTESNLLDTSIAGPILLPARCRFLWSDMKNLDILVQEKTKYSFIVIDPPWTNKSVRRKRPYQWSDFDQIRDLPVEQLIDRTRPTLICCWSTNCDRVEQFIRNDLFKKWNCQYLATWFWLKVTRTGEPVLPLNSIDKKSYETLYLAVAGDETHFDQLKQTSKIFCSVFSEREKQRKTFNLI